MQNFKHVVEHKYKPSFRNEKIKGLFDLNIDDKLTSSWEISIPIDKKEWSIGLIVGQSGAGKTTIAKKIFGDKFHDGFKWSQDSVVDCFPRDCSVEQITEALSKVGFSSPPAWLLPYSSLSNGQKFRCELARCLFEYDDFFVFDEFTSVVDRTVAKIGSHAFQKCIRKTGKKFVAVTCHYDVEEWLQPDWVFDVSKNEFKWGCLRRPEINVEIKRVSWHYWELFKKHHYLSGEISKSATCFCAFIDGHPIAFSSWLPHFGKLKNKRGARREHRTVVTPDFQGIGIGNILSNYCASLYKEKGMDVYCMTSHPAMIHGKVKSKQWILKSYGFKKQDKEKNGFKNTRSNGRRSTASLEYIGLKANPIESKNMLESLKKQQI